MKLYKFFLFVALTIGALMAVGCSEDDGVDNRDHDYGYVQFKLYKASDDASRAIQAPLEALTDAKKVKVALLYGTTTIAQTLNLQPAEGDAAAYGLRTEKLKLLTQ